MSARVPIKPVHGRLAGRPEAFCTSRSLNFVVVSSGFLGDDPPETVSCVVCQRLCRDHNQRPLQQEHRTLGPFPANADELIDLIDDDLTRALKAIRGNPMAAYDDIKRAVSRIHAYRVKETAPDAR